MRSAVDAAEERDLTRVHARSRASQSEPRGKLPKARPNEKVGRPATALHPEREVSGLGMDEVFSAKAADREAVATAEAVKLAESILF